MKRNNKMSVRVYEKNEKKEFLNKEDLILRKMGNNNLKVIADRFGIFLNK